MNCIFFVLVDLSRTITAGVGLGLRTVRGTSFCLIQLGPKTGGKFRRDGETQQLPVETDRKRRGISL